MFCYSTVELVALSVLICVLCGLVFWGYAVAIPSRNESVRSLQDRIQTLQYWLEEAKKPYKEQIAALNESLQKTHIRIAALQDELIKLKSEKL